MLTHILAITIDACVRVRVRVCLRFFQEGIIFLRVTVFFRVKNFINLSCSIVVSETNYFSFVFVWKCLYFTFPYSTLFDLGINLDLQNSCRDNRVLISLSAFPLWLSLCQNSDTNTSLFLLTRLQNFLHKCPLSFPGSCSGYHTALGNQASFVSSGLW